MHKKLQNELIAQGYITSRVQFDVQAVPAGILKVRVHYGRIGQLRMQAGSSTYFRPDTLFPIAAGDVLNLRRIEQGLENMGGIPGVISDIRIVPAERPGESDIEIFRRQDKYWRFTAWADDAGVSSAGRYQAGGALYLDNLTSLGDIFYLSMARSILAPPGKGNESRALYYSLPWGTGASARWAATAAITRLSPVTSPIIAITAVRSIGGCRLTIRWRAG